jgi:hypothetical protein
MPNTAADVIPAGPHTRSMSAIDASAKSAHRYRYQRVCGLIAITGPTDGKIEFAFDDGPTACSERTTSHQPLHRRAQEAAMAWIDRRARRRSRLAWHDRELTVAL